MTHPIRIRSSTCTPTLRPIRETHHIYLPNISTSWKKYSQLEKEGLTMLKKLLQYKCRCRLYSLGSTSFHSFPLRSRPRYFNNYMTPILESPVWLARYYLCWPGLNKEKTLLVQHFETHAKSTEQHLLKHPVTRGNGHPSPVLNTCRSCWTIPW